MRALAALILASSLGCASYSACLSGWSFWVDAATRNVSPDDGWPMNLDGWDARFGLRFVVNLSGPCRRPVEREDEDPEAVVD